MAVDQVAAQADAIPRDFTYPTALWLPGEVVTDTGPGISPEDQARLFQPFERLNAGTTDVEGSGIGLALTKNVVEAMGGTIGVDSAPGEGSTFWVVLPSPGQERTDGDGHTDAGAGSDGASVGDPTPTR